MATGVGRGGFLWHRSVARPWKPLLGASFSAIFPYKFLTPPPVTDCYILLIPPNNYAIFDHPPPLAPSTPVETTCRNLQLLWLYVNSVIFFIFLFFPGCWSSLRAAIYSKFVLCVLFSVKFWMKLYNFNQWDRLANSVLKSRLLTDVLLWYHIQQVEFSWSVCTPRR